jgi:hypothetical protein
MFEYGHTAFAFLRLFGSKYQIFGAHKTINRSSAFVRGAALRRSSRPFNRSSIHSAARPVLISERRSNTDIAVRHFDRREKISDVLENKKH